MRIIKLYIYFVFPFSASSSYLPSSSYHRRQLYFPMGSARLQERVPDCNGQCRTSTGSSRLQWAVPGLNPEFQIAVGSTGPQSGIPDCSGQCRASFRGLPSGVGSAGSHPGEPSGMGSANMSDRNVRRYIRKILRDIWKGMSTEIS